MDLLQPRGDGEPLIIASFTSPPYATAALTANLVFRIALALLGNMACLVPLRLLWRNSELAAVIFIINVELKNFQTIIYALIWRNDDLESWWPGYGLCDAGAFFHNFSIGLFATCMLAIMRNLASQLGLARAHPMTTKEKRRRNLVQCLIMFPLPLLQLGFTWFLTAQRYTVGALVGCTWVGYGAWPYLVFFIVAPVAVSMVTVSYAILCYSRFRQVVKATRTALSSNRAANYRAQRTRRRLYLMIISILVPYFPIIVAICIVNGFGMGGLKPFDYNQIHHHAEPFPWNSILYMRSDQIDFVVLNNCYIPILTTIPVFLFFGTTKAAINDYRLAALKLGLARFWPGLCEEYDPDRPNGSGSFGSTSSQGGVTNPASRYTSLKCRFTNSADPLSTISSNNTDDTAQPSQSLNFLTQPSQEAGLSNAHPLRSHSTTATPHEDTTATPQRPQRSYDTTIHRNPFLMRTHMDFSTLKVPSLFRSAKPSNPLPSPCASQPNHPYPLQSLQPTISRGIHTRVWSSDEEARHLVTGAENNSREPTRQSGSSDQEPRGVRIQTSVTRETAHRTQR